MIVFININFFKEMMVVYIFSVCVCVCNTKHILRMKFNRIKNIVIYRPNIKIYNIM